MALDTLFLQPLDKDSESEFNNLLKKPLTLRARLGGHIEVETCIEDVLTKVADCLTSIAGSYQRIVIDGGAASFCLNRKVRALKQPKDVDISIFYGQVEEKKREQLAENAKKAVICTLKYFFKSEDEKSLWKNCLWNHAVIDSKILIYTFGESAHTGFDLRIYLDEKVRHWTCLADSLYIVYPDRIAGSYELPFEEAQKALSSNINHSTRPCEVDRYGFERYINFVTGGYYDPSCEATKEFLKKFRDNKQLSSALLSYLQKFKSDKSDSFKFAFLLNTLITLHLLSLPFDEDLILQTIKSLEITGPYLAYIQRNLELCHLMTLISPFSLAFSLISIQKNTYLDTEVISLPISRTSNIVIPHISFSKAIEGYLQLPLNVQESAEFKNVFKILRENLRKDSELLIEPKGFISALENLSLKDPHLAWEILSLFPNCEPSDLLLKDLNDLLPSEKFPFKVEAFLPHLAKWQCTNDLNLFITSLKTGLFHGEFFIRIGFLHCIQQISNGNIPEEICELAPYFKSISNIKQLCSCIEGKTEASFALFFNVRLLLQSVGIEKGYLSDFDSLFKERFRKSEIKGTVGEYLLKCVDEEKLILTPFQLRSCFIKKHKMLHLMGASHMSVHLSEKSTLLIPCISTNTLMCQLESMSISFMSDQSFQLVLDLIFRILNKNKDDLFLPPDMQEVINQLSMSQNAFQDHLLWNILFLFPTLQAPLDLIKKTSKVVNHLSMPRQRMNFIEQTGPYLEPQFGKKTTLELIKLSKENPEQEHIVHLLHFLNHCLFDHPLTTEIIYTKSVSDLVIVLLEEKPNQAVWKSFKCLIQQAPFEKEALWRCIGLAAFHFDLKEIESTLIQIIRETNPQFFKEEANRKVLLDLLKKHPSPELAWTMFQTLERHLEETLRVQIALETAEFLLSTETHSNIGATLYVNNFLKGSFDLHIATSFPLFLKALTILKDPKITESCLAHFLDLPLIDIDYEQLFDLISGVKEPLMKKWERYLSEINKVELAHKLEEQHVDLQIQAGAIDTIFKLKMKELKETSGTAVVFKKHLIAKITHASFEKLKISNIKTIYNQIKKDPEFTELHAYFQKEGLKKLFKPTQESFKEFINHIDFVFEFIKDNNKDPVYFDGALFLYEFEKHDKLDLFKAHHAKIKELFGETSFKLFFEKDVKVVQVVQQPLSKKQIVLIFILVFIIATTCIYFLEPFKHFHPPRRIPAPPLPPPLPLTRAQALPLCPADIPSQCLQTPVRDC